MTPIENPKSQIANPAEPLPLSLLNDYLYCPRRAALKIVEGWRSANEHTARGDIVHEHADLAGYEVVKGVTLLRALPVFSERLGLSGKCDIVEVHPLTRPSGPLSPRTGVGTRSTASVEDPESKNSDAVERVPTQLVHRFNAPLLRGNLSPTGGEGRGEGAAIGSLVPVEFKLGKRRKWENDDAQLCAQALCLEEMFNVSIPRGAIFHAESKRRREVEFTTELRRLTEQAAAELHRLLAAGRVPPALFKPACEECSLFEVCLPKATENPGRIERAASALFRT